MPNEFLNALDSLTGYLKDENRRRDEEFLKEKQKVSAQRIADAFKTLGPESSESDVRQVMYKMIDDAASLDALDKNLPLISSFHNDSLKSIKNYKEQKQDIALREYAASELGMDMGDVSPNMTGKDLFDIAKFRSTQLVKKDITNTLGQIDYKIYDPRNNKELFSLRTDERTDDQRARLEYKYKPSTGGSAKPGPYPGITEKGNLPIMIAPDGELYVQESGMLVKYDSNRHGGIRKWASQDGNTTKETKDILKLAIDSASKTYGPLEDEARLIADLLGIQPQADMTAGKTVTSFNKALRKNYPTDRGLWAAIREKIIIRAGGDPKKKNALGQIDDKEQPPEIRKELDAYYNKTWTVFKGYEERYNKAQELHDKTMAEYNNRLAPGSLDDYDLESSRYLADAFDVDVKLGSGNRSAKDIVDALQNGGITPEQATGWLFREKLKAKAHSRGKTLSGRRDEYMELYNSLSYNEKAELYKDVLSQTKENTPTQPTQ